MNDQQNLDNLRHSCAHLLAAAVIELWPDAKRTIGPTIENGFYYDFDFGDIKISASDFPKIEQRMRELIKTWEKFEMHQLTPEQARKEYPNNPYKHELISEFSKTDHKLSFYKSGKYWDLCRGGHIDDPSQQLKHFKLLSVAGAYWRGNEKNKMLTRIYGTIFLTTEELNKYLMQIEEAKKRDHKKLGKELDLFFFSDLVGPGLALWTPKGTLIRNLVDDFVWQLRKEKGYQKVMIPHITKKELYEKSGHWLKFANELFKIKSREGHLFAMKPMNCPHHTQIFAHIPRSYRDMPQRYAETTVCYRDEQTGELSGLSRVRSFTQDDAHVFCQNSQVENEFNAIWDIVKSFYSAFGFQLKVRLSFHDPNNMKAYLGDEDGWKKTELTLKSIADKRKTGYQLAIGEAAFYGPKIDFLAQDSLLRQWQVATIQLDMNMPYRFDLSCVNEKGEKERIVMIHAAIMGSIERFLSILIEHFAGAFPLWLTPVQVKMIPISADQLTYAQQVADLLSKNGIRVEVDGRADRMQKKIRDAQLEKVFYMAVVGERESASETVTVRERSGKQLEPLKLAKFVELVQQKITQKSVD